MVHDSPCSFPATAVMGEVCIKVGPQSSWGQRGDAQVDLWPNIGRHPAGWREASLSVDSAWILDLPPWDSSPVGTGCCSYLSL